MVRIGIDRVQFHRPFQRSFCLAWLEVVIQQDLPLTGVRLCSRRI